MFDYVANEYNPTPRLVLERRPSRPDRRAVFLPWSTSLVAEVPRTQEELRARRSARHWKKLRRLDRRFAEEFGAPPSFEVLTTPATIAPWLDPVRQLFADRWADEYTSLDWRTPAGFAPYADAVLRLAAEGRAALVVLAGDGRLLAFAYCLLDPPWMYFYQHAATPAAAYRAYGPGTMLVSRLLAHLTEQDAITHLDLMLGEAPYKAHWTTTRRQVWLRLEAPATPLGAARLAVLVPLARLRLYVQFHNPRLRALAKQLLRARQQWPGRRRQRTGPHPAAGVLAPAGARPDGDP